MSEPERKQVRKRFILSSATGLALAAVTGFPMTGWLIETKQAKDRSDQSAMHLAIAGAHRGLWTLQRDGEAVAALEQGRGVPGLAGDRLYADAAGGAYSVEASFDEASGAIVVAGTGVDGASGRTRTVEIRLEKGAGGLTQTRWTERRP